MKTITTDYEHNCETWWDAARSSPPPPSCAGLINDTDTLTVTDADSREFVEWASRLDGWEESPFVIN